MLCLVGKFLIHASSAWMIFVSKRTWSLHTVRTVLLLGRKFIRTYAMELVLVLNKLARASRRRVNTNGASKVLPSKRLLLASLSSVLLQIAPGLLWYNCENSSHQILTCNKGLLCLLETSVLSYCTLYLLHSFLCCCAVKSPWCE